MSSNEKAQNDKSVYAHLKQTADEEVALKIFDLIEQSPSISQRKIVMQTGLAAGLVHSFMRRVIAKGWIRAKQVSPKRWLYFLTPDGFIEKSRISMNYLSRTLQSYKKTQKIVTNLLELCMENEWYRIVVAGGNELAEIAVINILGATDFQLVGVVSDTSSDAEIAGRKVFPYENIEQMEFDRLWVCDLEFNESKAVEDLTISEERLIYLVDSVVGSHSSVF